MLTYVTVTLFTTLDVLVVFVDDNNVSRLALNPEWLNVQADSNTVNVSDTEIEFGFGKLLLLRLITEGCLKLERQQSCEQLT